MKFLCFSALILIATAAFAGERNRPVQRLVANCVEDDYSYCAENCDDLGDWVVESFDDMESARSAYDALDVAERVSAFVVQVPSTKAGALVLRRERKSRPAPRPNFLAHAWFISEHETVMDAAAAAHLNGGYVFATNEIPVGYIRVWFQDCVAIPPAACPAP